MADDAHGHYATHGTINSLQLSAPKYTAATLVQTASGKYSNTTGKYVKLAEANT